MNNALLSRPGTMAHPLTGILTRFGQIYALRQQRWELAKLGPAALNDIGLTPEEAQIEAKRPIWDLPSFMCG